jgi:hypothetical protein
VGRVPERVHVLEVDSQRVADARRISGPGMSSPSALSLGAFAIGFFQCGV